MVFINHIKITNRLRFKPSSNLLMSRYFFSRALRSSHLSSFSISLSLTVLETLFFQPLTQCNILLTYKSSFVSLKAFEELCNEKIQRHFSQIIVDSRVFRLLVNLTHAFCGVVRWTRVKMCPPYSRPLMLRLASCMYGRTFLIMLPDSLGRMVYQIFRRTLCKVR